MTYEEFLKKNTDLRHYIREQEKVNKAKEPKKFIKIEKVSFEKGLCLLSNGEKKKIEDIVKIVLVGQDCVSNPSILALWSGFKTISANVPKKEVKKEDLSKESFDDLKDLITDSDELEKSLLQGNTKSNAYLDMYSKVEKIIKNRNEVLSKSVERLKEIEDYFEKNIAPRLEKFESYAEKFNFYPNESVVRHEEYWEDYINFVYKTLGIKKKIRIV